MRLEEQTQSAILQFVELQFPMLYRTRIKIDNEGKRSMAGLMTAIKCGLHPGASDLFFAFPTKKFHGLFIEVKPDGWTKPRNKKESTRVQKQLEFINDRKLDGYQAHFVVGVDQGIKAIREYMKPYAV